MRDLANAITRGLVDANRVIRGVQPPPTGGANSRFVVPPPIRGWNTLDSESAMHPEYALELTNFFPEEGRVTGRAGCVEYVDITGEAGEIGTLAGHRAGSVNAFYAFSGSALYDVTDPDSVTEVSGAEVTNSRWRYAHTTAALVAVNGVDAPLRITRTPSGASTIATAIAHGWTGTGLVPGRLAYVSAHHNRFFFGEADSPVLWYGGLGSETGALEKLDLGLVVSDGGNVRAIGSFTLDTGSGVDDLLGVYLQSGKVVLFAGTDPGDASNWRTAGVFAVGQPVGDSALVKRGGDLIAITVDGYVDLLPYLHAERADPRIVLSDKIAPTVRGLVNRHGQERGWQAVMHAPANVLIFNVPLGGGLYEQHVSNLQTGAWARFTGWNAACWGQFNDRLYFGTPDGKVIEAFRGQDDCGVPAEARIRSAFNYLGTPRNKKINLVRAHTESAGGTNRVNVGVALDFDRDLPASSIALLRQLGTPWGAPAPPPSNEQGSPVWNTFAWGAGVARHRAWRPVGKIGSTVSIHLAASTAGDPVSYFGTDVEYQVATGV